MQKIFTFNTEPGTGVAPDSDVRYANLFKHELIEQAYRHLPAGLFANLGLSLLVVAGLSSKVASQKLLLWLAAIWGLSIVRAFLIRSYNTSSPSEKRQPHWGVIFTVGVLFSGFFWGVSPYYIFAADSVPHQTFLVFVIGGMIAGGTTTMASMQKTYRSFVLLLGTPVTVKFILLGGETHIPMAMMVLIYLIICIIMSSHIHTMFISSLRLRLENREVQKKLLKQERLAAIGKLAGSVAHDIRNPLGSIRNSIYFLSHTIEAETDSKIYRHLGLMDREIDRANTIISGLLDVSVKNEPLLEEDDLNLLIRTLADDFDIPENITLKTELDPSLPVFMFDHGQIQRVIQNLITNAIQAMPDGGTLHIESSLQKDIVEITVRDSGSGIAPENLNDIFEPLFTTRTRGVGLGLAIVRTFIENHQGTITVASEINRGTTFTIRLPVQIEQKKI
ncbi:MAG: hypothetical protein KKG47_02770 [Proteobacteria bacterium]|nr:hypothetical protein [Pseudomonadota bacterium]MBU1737907.1 hypothetical protein [Pseudomonadota bacterium]